jgi:serine/threonine protein kinase
MEGLACAAQVRSFGQQLLESVAYLHELRLIHTDLKPENILLTSLEFSRQAAPSDARCGNPPAAAATMRYALLDLLGGYNHGDSI